MGNIKFSIEQLTEPSKTISEILVNFYEQMKDLESDIIQKKVTEKKTRPAVERSNSEPVAKKQEVAASFFKICK